MTEFAKEKSKLWAPVVMHKVHNAYGLPPDRQNTQFLGFFALFGAQKPNSGVEIFPKTNFFFFEIFRFFDKALAHTKCTGGAEKWPGNKL